VGALPLWLPEALYGLCLGFLTAWAMDWVANRYIIKHLSAAGQKNAIMLMAFMKLLLDVLILFLVHRRVVLLLGTACGLLLEKQYIIWKTFLEFRKKRSPYS
jgi:hypothetical protein